MREPKPKWRDVPVELRKQVEEIMGSSIRTATQVFGGYGPSATFRIFLEDGRTLFAKGAGLGSVPENWRVLPTEETVYREVAAISSICPRYFGSVKVEGWHLLLLEDLKNTKKVPPWTEELALQAIRDIASFHARGHSDNGKVKSMEKSGFADNWLNIKNRSDERNAFLGLFRERRDEAEAWLDANMNSLVQFEAGLLRPDQPWGFIHSDIRSDNLRFRGGTTVLFDWALACSGPFMFDVGFFFPSIEGEGGPRAERLLPEYKRVMASHGIEFPAFSERSVAVAAAGYFATRAGKPPIPQLPRLRSIQRLQLGPALRWTSNLLGLPQPPLINFNEMVSLR
ncbi:aminoglycoside phosphotransferase family protein [Cohnella caldifontis]|uniref:aminoglycoside phosphotransferase family protein n=1 Tax=Cohnella caldifontis TaxID=3027471 RepID=UPI0023ED5EDB|nr:aminoglycoside phosphotransferase family protein [Cohnella sp. YIM B05605]